MSEITTINGRYIVHFTNLLTKDEDESVDRNNINFVSELFRIAKNKAKVLSGKEYRGKAYGGGIAFPSWEHAEQAIKLLGNERYNNAITLLLQAEIYFEKSKRAGVSYCNTGWKKKHEKELEYAREGEERVKAVFANIKIDYPGLYPSFEIENRHHYNIGSLIVHELKRI